MENTEVISKRCTKCGEWKPRSPEYFHRTNATSDGLHTQCKECRNAMRQQRYAETAFDDLRSERKQTWQRKRAKIFATPEAHQAYLEANRENWHRNKNKINAQRRVKPYTTRRLSGVAALFFIASHAGELLNGEMR